MTATETENPPNSEEVSNENPGSATSNPDVLKEANEKLTTLDVLVCGKCHTVFHFVEEFKEHKDGSDCTGKSPVRDNSETKAQVWAFLLWKCSSNDRAGVDSWKLYQEWCKMPFAQRNAWIEAGSAVQSLSNHKVNQMPKKVAPSSPEKKVYTKPKKAPIVTPAKEPIDKESVRNAQERVPAEDRIARRTNEGVPDDGEFVVEKILAKRFNPKRKQYEYLLKWEGYPHDQNTWEPTENMETCKHLVDAFEKQLARQKELKALRAQQQTKQIQQQQIQQQQKQQQQKMQQNKLQNIQNQLNKSSTSFQAIKRPATEDNSLTPSGRLARTSKSKALDQVKAWCGAGAAEEPEAKRIKRESSDEDFDAELFKEKITNGDSKSIDPELVKSLGLTGKGMPNIKGVIKVDPKHMPSLSTGVYIMSKSSGIMKIDSPGKIGQGLNIDQDVIRKQILAAKQKAEEAKKKSPANIPSSQVKKTTFGSGTQHMVEKTIITPSGQKIIQRAMPRPTPSANNMGKSPISVLNKSRAQTETPIKARSGISPRGKIISTPVSASSPKVNQTPKQVVIQEKEMQWDTGSDTSDGISDPFPTSPIPEISESPTRELTLCPESGRRLARAENEPTPPPTPEPEPETEPMLMKVEMSPGGTTGMLIHSDGAQPSLPMLTEEDGTEMKVEAQNVKELLENADVEEGSGALMETDTPLMVRGEDGVLYQVAGENEEGQTLLVAAEENAENEDGVVYVTRADGQDVLALEPSQLAQLLPGADEAPQLPQVAVQLEGDGDDTTQVIAQLVQADLPSPGGTRRVVLLLPDGSFTMTELDKEQYESITEAAKTQE